MRLDDHTEGPEPGDDEVALEGRLEVGGGLTPTGDVGDLRSIARDAGKNGNKFSTLVLDIVKSKPFQMNMKMQQTSVQPNKEKGN